MKTGKAHSVRKYRCKFCGAKIFAEGFCEKCKREGFDDVYEVTHRSNGWEKRLVKTGKVR